jgi:hypothetical protein
MALVVNDRVKETSTTTGTGTFDLAGAASGFQTFVAGVGDTNTTYYTIFNQGTTEWEVGLGTVTDAATDTLARTTVITSSNSGSAVDFAAGTKDVFCTLPASVAVFGKQEGTNFTNSILVGHTTTGTLDAAEDNTGVGIAALDALTSADKNTAIGYSSLSGVTTGNNNVGVGYNAGVGITGAPDNTIVGGQAFEGSATSATSGYNTAVGAHAMKVSSGAAFNTAIGRDAGREVTSGDYNVFLGYNAAANDSSAGITTGSGNVIIGTVDPASRTGDHQLKIANYNGSSTVTWMTGDSSGNVVFAGTATAASGQLSTTGTTMVLGF